MAQVFHPAAVLALKVGALAGAAMLVAGSVALYRVAHARPAPGDAAQQPIPFSHKHHVGDDGIDCRYCHESVETAAFAGIPATEVCMGCHSQLFTDSPLLEPLRRSARTGERLRWSRVHRLPDFVYFDHSIHVAKGVACIECHGRIDEMPLVRTDASLEMQWCLECHRDPGPHLRPPGEVFEMRPTPRRPREADDSLVKAAHLASLRRRTDCSTCHR
jgi:hypothetical protein